MAAAIQDFQFNPLVISNDNTEQVVYSATIPAFSVTTTYRYQIILGGVISTRAVLPGTLTLRIRLDTGVSVVVSETPLTGASNVRFNANLEAWFRADGNVGLSGFFVQNAGDLMTPSGARLGASATTVDVTQDNILTATIQFSTADPANTFTRGLAALFLLTG